MKLRDWLIKKLGGLTRREGEDRLAAQRSHIARERADLRAELKETNAALAAYRRIAARQINVRDVFPLRLPRVYTDVGADYRIETQHHVVAMRTRQLSVSFAFTNYEIESPNFKEVFLISVEKMIEALHVAFAEELRRSADEALGRLGK